jgi:hypothetical protein
LLHLRFHTYSAAKYRLLQSSLPETLSVTACMALLKEEIVHRTRRASVNAKATAKQRLEDFLSGKSRISSAQQRGTRSPRILPSLRSVAAAIGLSRATMMPAAAVMAGSPEQEQVQFELTSYSTCVQWPGEREPEKQKCAFCSSDVRPNSIVGALSNITCAHWQRPPGTEKVGSVLNYKMNYIRKVSEVCC